MNALVLHDAEQMELRVLPPPVPQPHEVLLQVGAVGLCGTDFHIFEGKANYNFDATGRVIPLDEEAPAAKRKFSVTNFAARLSKSAAPCAT